MSMSLQSQFALRLYAEADTVVYTDTQRCGDSEVPRIHWDLRHTSHARRYGPLAAATSAFLLDMTLDVGEYKRRHLCCLWRCGR